MGFSDHMLDGMGDGMGGLFGNLLHGGEGGFSSSFVFFYRQGVIFWFYFFLINFHFSSHSDSVFTCWQAAF